MKTTMAIPIPPLFFILLLLSRPTPSAAAEGRRRPENNEKKKNKPGICYGTVGDGLPSPEKVVKMLISNNITRVRIYNPDPTLLSAFSNTSIHLTVGLPNEEIPSLATNQTHALLFLSQHLLSPSLLLRRITVGNEYVDPNTPTALKDLQSLHDAILNIHKAISSLALPNPPEVSTVIHMAMLASSFPPSGGAFRPELAPGMGELAKLLRKNNASLLVNVYPYFAYIEDSIDIPLSYALFMGRKWRVRDGNSTYWNLYDAMVEAVRAAVRRVGGAGVGVVVGETGWPTRGNRAASLENARTYNENLGRHVGGEEVYIFAMFDENRKRRGVERRWGLFNSDMSAKYNLSFYGGTMVRNSSSLASPPPPPPPPPLHSPFKHLNTSFSVRGSPPPPPGVLVLVLLVVVSMG